MTDNALTETSGFKSLLEGFATRSNSLVEQNVTLHDKNVEAQNAIAERDRAIHENNVMIETNDRKATAIRNMLRDFDDADQFRARALEDYRG